MSDCSNLKRPTALIIDDAAANIEVIAACLGNEFDVYVATSGVTGLRVAYEKVPDIILLDVVMPGMDGYAVCARLKAEAKTKDIPVIFVTALGELNNEEKGLSLGAVDYINKPIIPAIVRARVENHVQLKRLRDVAEKARREAEQANDAKRPSRKMLNYWNRL